MWCGHLPQIDHLDQEQLESIARTCTKPKKGNGYRNSQAFRAAKRQGTAELWKAALKKRKEARKKWELERLQRASQGDWGAFKALKQPRQVGWDVAFAESQTQDPHQAVHDHLSAVYAGEAVPMGEKWQGDVLAFTLDELRAGIAHMKRGKSVGVDGTSVEMLIGVVETPGGEAHLLEYFNRVLATQEIPDKWNEPLLIMLPKVSQPTHPKQLRPVAMSSAVGKLFARLLLNRAPQDFAIYTCTVRWQAPSDSRLSLHCLTYNGTLQGVGTPTSDVQVRPGKGLRSTGSQLTPSTARGQDWAMCRIAVLERVVEHHQGFSADALGVQYGGHEQGHKARVGGVSKVLWAHHRDGTCDGG